MRLLLEEIVRRCRAGESVALCTVVDTRGSTPQKRGARMLVAADGKSVGTLGGGCVEAEVRKHALEALARRESKLMEFQLDHDYGWDDGLICGGAMDIHIACLSSGQEAPYADALDSLREGRGASLRLTYQQEGEQREFVEEVSAGTSLLIAGAGHVAQAVARMAAGLEFRLTVIDDRPEFANEARFPTAAKCIVGPIDERLRSQPIDPQTFIVIVTRGHNRDGAALAAVIDSPAKYIGLIGSKRKIKAIFDDLHAQGVPIEQLARVHSPIGFDIGAVTVDEIAISIVAELVAVRRGMECPAARMKMDSQEIDRWLNRSRK